MTKDAATLLDRLWGKQTYTQADRDGHTPT